MFETIKNALIEATGLPFADTAYDRPPAGDYGLIALDGNETHWSDNHAAEEAVEGTVDVFTHSNGLDLKCKVQEVLNSFEVGWSLNSVQYEQNTRFTHLEWIVRWSENG